ncbi:hypothetical protein Tco_0872092 [Tanacetum coccineum]
MRGANLIKFSKLEFGTIEKQPRIGILSFSTLHFLKILENSLEVVMVLKNSLKVLKVLKNSLEVLKRHASDTQEYPSLIDTFWRTHTVDRVFPKDEDRRIGVSTRRMRSMRWQEGVDFMMSLFRSESGGASGSGGCGDDEESGDDEDDDGER